MTTITSKTVREAVDQFLGNVEERVSENTLKEYRRWLPIITELETEAGFRLGDIPYVELTEAHIGAALYAFANSVGRTRKGRRLASGEQEVLAGRRPSPATIRNTAAYLSAFIADRQRAYGIAGNPMAGVSRREYAGKRKPVRERVHLDDAQVATLLDSIKAHYSDIATLIAFTGLRSGEARGLDWANVDLDGEYINVIEQSTQDGKRIAPLKTESSVRVVGLVGPALDALRRRHKAMGKPSSGLVFATKSGSAPSATNLWKAVAKAAADAGLPAMGVHDLRHSVASRMHHAGVSFDVIAGVLGHASVTTTTEFYSTPNVSDAMKVEAMKRALGGSS